MRKILFIFVLFLTTLLNTKIYSQQQSKIETFVVKDRQVNCEAVVPQKCLQVKRDNQTKFRLFYDDIENFAFIEGYEYVLRVEVVKLEVIPKDTSGYRYLLKEILSRKKVETAKNNSERLFNRKWRLEFLKGKKVENNNPFIKFDFDKNGFTGNTGCNLISGQYSINQNSIELSKMIMTKKACVNTDNVETSFLQSLSETNKFEVFDDSLYFYNDGIVVLHFKPEISQQ